MCACVERVCVCTGWYACVHVHVCTLCPGQRPIPAVAKQGQPSQHTALRLHACVHMRVTLLTKAAAHPSHRKTGAAQPSKCTVSALVCTSVCAPCALGSSPSQPLQNRGSPANTLRLRVCACPRAAVCSSAGQGRGARARRGRQPTRQTATPQPQPATHNPPTSSVANVDSAARASLCGLPRTSANMAIAVRRDRGPVKGGGPSAGRQQRAGRGGVGAACADPGAGFARAPARAGSTVTGGQHWGGQAVGAYDARLLHWAVTST